MCYQNVALALLTCLIANKMQSQPNGIPWPFLSTVNYKQVKTCVSPALPNHSGTTFMKIVDDLYPCDSSFQHTPYLPVYYSKYAIHWFSKALKNVSVHHEIFSPFTEGSTNTLFKQSVRFLSAKKLI